MRRLRRTLLEYSVTIAAVAAAIGLRWLVDPIVGSRIPFAFNLAAVAVAVGVGGLYPALFAAAAGYAALSYFFVEPRGALRVTTPADWITFAGYLIACAAVIVFGLLMRRANRRLEAAAQELAALNHRKDELLATVAHELRQPLAPIQQAVALLDAPAVSETEYRAVREIVGRQVRHLGRLVDDLIDLDRIARDQLQLRLACLPLTAVIENAVATSRSMIDGRRHDLRVELPKAPVYVTADPVRLEQVVVNLLSNAAKFTPAGGVIRLACREEGGEAVIEVQDSGIGVAPEAVPHLCRATA